MKKFKALALILSYCLLTSCSSQTPNKYISSKLDIQIPKEVKIIMNDNHGGFHGDGSTYARIKLENEIAKKLRAEIAENDNWNALPLSDNLQLIMYGGTKGKIRYCYYLAHKTGIPLVENGYWIFIDRFDDKNILNEDEKLFKRGSYNFTLAIYDTDTDILYYFEYDT